jgi:hypothetical protein
MSKILEPGLAARVRSVAEERILAWRSPRGPKATLQKLADYAVVRPAAYLVRRLGFRNDVITRVKALAAEDSARYVLDAMMPCAVFDTRYELFDLSMRQAPSTGLLLEFGVFNGKSINYWSKHASHRPIWGFDSFEGLAEDWGGTGMLKRAFDVGGKLPKVTPNVTLVKGWFDKTLPPFLAEHPGPIAFAHLDADTYDSTKYVLDQLVDRLVVGTVLQFDEYLGYPAWRNGEHRAFQELCQQHAISYSYLGVGLWSVAVQITAIGR